MRNLFFVAGALAVLGYPQASGAQTAETPVKPLSPSQAPPVSAAPAMDRASYVPAAELQAVLARAGGDGKSLSLSKRLFTTRTFSTSFIRLNEPDRPKVHGVWSELFVVQQGAGVVQIGGDVTGEVSSDAAAHRGFFVDPSPAGPQSEAEIKAAAARREAQGDKSGTEQVGGTMQPVAAGDLLLIPAGVAHRWARIDQPVVYLAIKFPKEGER